MPIHPSPIAPPRRPYSRRLHLVTIGIAAAVLIVSASALAQQPTASVASAPKTAAVPPQSPTFDVASIRENNSIGGRSHIYSSAHAARFSTINVSGTDLLQFAFNIPKTRILDAPGWLSNEKFDIVAKSDSLDVTLAALTDEQGKQTKREMLQALLADRFQLKLHHETRTLPVYALVVAKSGPRLKPAETNGSLVNSSNGHIAIESGEAVTVLAALLAEDLGRVVLDRTGITGRYDVTLTWTPDTATSNTATDPSGPSLFTALEEQLGIKLESDKAPVDVLVIDHIDQPTPN